MKHVIAFLLAFFLLPQLTVARALFEPPANQTLLIIGQDLGAIGGFPAPNNDGYLDHGLPAPAGVTTYLSLPSLRGLTSKVNLWSGDLWAQGIIDNPTFKHSALAIGLHFVDQEEKIAAGKQDAAIEKLARWIKSAQRPVFLRIGYEFDGSWNHYKPEPYREAFRRIVTIFRRLEVTNCAYVWQSCTSLYSGYQKQDIADWYPGDDYVDWVGYSWFLTAVKQVELTDRLLAFARAHGKPVMVCEAAPQGYDLARLTKRSLANGQDSKPKTPEEIWAEWYVPFFAYIEKNHDVVKAVA
ncbi:MAG: glycosyl hydrolase, partial [Rariglobus sp.]